MYGIWGLNLIEPLKKQKQRIAYLRGVYGVPDHIPPPPRVTPLESEFRPLAGTSPPKPSPSGISGGTGRRGGDFYASAQNLPVGVGRPPEGIARCRKTTGRRCRSAGNRRHLCRRPPAPHTGGKPHGGGIFMPPLKNMSEGDPAAPQGAGRLPESIVGSPAIADTLPAGCRHPTRGANRMGGGFLCLRSKIDCRR